MGEQAERFALVPRYVVETELTATQRHLYEALALHARGKTRMARPSVETLARIVHKSPRTVRRTLRSLELAGVIELAIEGGGRARPTSYHLPRNPDTQSVPLSGEETRTSESETRTSESETRTSENQNPDIWRPKPGHPGCPPNRRTDEQKEQMRDFAAEPADAARGSPLDNGASRGDDADDSEPVTGSADTAGVDEDLSEKIRERFKEAEREQLEKNRRNREKREKAEAEMQAVYGNRR